MSEDPTQAVLDEVQALLDETVDGTTLKAGDDGVAAITGLVELFGAMAQRVALYRGAARGEL